LVDVERLSRCITNAASSQVAIVLACDSTGPRQEGTVPIGRSDRESEDAASYKEEDEDERRRERNEPGHESGDEGEDMVPLSGFVIWDEPGRSPVPLGLRDMTLSSGGHATHIQIDLHMRILD
jgi:hypothetical protein